MNYELNTHNLSESFFQQINQTKDFVSDSVNSLNQSVQQARDSLRETVISATNKTVDTVTTLTSDSVKTMTETLEQTTSSLDGALQTTIFVSANNWLVEHPALFRLVQILSWAANHPIWSLIIVLFAIALAWSIIKAIVRLIETASWSIIQVPFKLILGFVKVSFLSLSKIGGVAVKQLTNTKANVEIPALPPATSQPIHKDKTQRLKEISNRLEEIQKEQNELLQEAAELMAADKSTSETQNLKSNS